MVSEHTLAFAVGILGNIISFLVFLAPVPTFSRIYKQKSTEGFHSVPYIIAFFSCMLWVFYALVKTNDAILITINSIGLFIELIYISIYLFYAPANAKKLTARILVFLNVIGFGIITALILLAFHGKRRLVALGWICVFFSASVFVAPLSVMRKVIRTKSVEFMPFYLSFFLTISAAVWLTYGVLSKDIYITLPNILGLLFGIGQMALYCFYKNAKPMPADQSMTTATFPEIKLVLSEDSAGEREGVGGEPLNEQGV